MEINQNFKYKFIFLYFFGATVCAQHLDYNLIGKWVLNGGKSYILISDKNFKFDQDPFNDSDIFLWVKSKPEDKKQPQTPPSSDGMYNICFYTGHTISKKEMSTDILNVKKNTATSRKEGLLSLGQYNREIRNIQNIQKTIDRMNDGSLRPISCNRFFYLKNEKIYESANSNDLNEFYVFDQNKLYRWRENLAVSSVELLTYQKK